MAKLRTILKRRKTARSIRGVTRTMEMVASAQFRRAHDMAGASRPLAISLGEVVCDLVARGGRKPFHHPLLEENKGVDKDVMFILSSNRGLCGGYNSAVMKLGMERMGQVLKAGYKVELHVVGKRGVQFAHFRGLRADAEHTDLDDIPDYDAVATITGELVRRYVAKEISGAEIAYTQFVSAGRQGPAVAQILPLTDFAEETDEKKNLAEPEPYELHPSTEAVLEHLLMVTVRLRAYQCFIDAAASEHRARITSMHAATKNAGEMIRDLTREYNRLRQGRITTELAEIMGGRIGLDKQ